MYTDEDYKKLKSVILFWKCILTNPKKPGAIFFLMPFSNIKKNILTNPKRPGAIFCSSLFQILRISKNTTFYTNNNLHKNHYTNQ